MRKDTLAAILLLLFNAAVSADEDKPKENPPPEASTAVETGPGADPAIQAARAWLKTGEIGPLQGKDGLVRFPYGEYQPTLICAPLRACDVELESGEAISNVALGDTVRWLTAPAQAGDTQHVIIKPTETGLTTNLIVTTDRRAYHLTLISRKNDYMPRVGFYYPRELVQQWNDAAHTQETKRRAAQENTVADMPTVTPEQLRFDYRIKADRDTLPPVRVFDDGTRAYIQMPEDMRSGEAPALVVLDGDDNSVLVNYRVKSRYYIVDRLFDRAALLVGTGKDQRKVVIERVKEDTSRAHWRFGH